MLTLNRSSTATARVSWTTLGSALRLLSVLLVLPLAASCSTFAKSRVVVAETNAVKVEKFRPARPRPVFAFSLDSRDFIKAITPTVAQNLLEELKADKIAPFSFVCFSPQNYLTFSTWLADVQRYVRETNTLLEYYESDGIPKVKP